MTTVSKAYFVTGTDTDVGKTLVVAGLLAAARQRGVSTLAIKPVAAGCSETSAGLQNDDALQLMQHMSVPLSYQQVNPVALQPPIAPHIAAQQIGRTLRLDGLVSHCRQVLTTPAEFALVEGAGGWRLPLNDTEYLSALPKALALPVILVVGMKLGCLNHALLTAETIAKDGVALAGWIASCVDVEMSCFEENLASLKSHLNAPLLGVIPYLPEAKNRVAQAAGYLSIEALI